MFAGSIVVVGAVVVFTVTVGIVLAVVIVGTVVSDVHCVPCGQIVVV